MMGQKTLSGLPIENDPNMKKLVSEDFYIFHLFCNEKSKVPLDIMISQKIQIEITLFNNI